MLIVFASCGKKGITSSKSKTAAISEEEIQAVMANQVFDCASLDGSACPEGITRLLILNKKKSQKSKLCTGFMMGSDTMITNQHCISNIGDCRNTYVAVYNGHSYEQNRCHSIVRLLSDQKNSADPGKQLDVAIVKLEKKYSGKVFEPATTPARNGDFVRSWVIDHTGSDLESPNLLESRVTEIRCRATPMQGFQSLILSDCPVIQGNSGSPLLDRTGKVIGVIWGGTSDAKANTDLDSRRASGGYASVTELVHFLPFLKL